MSAIGRYFLDGVDMYSQYGLVVMSGSDTFLQPRRRKPTLSHDWPEQNGTEYDLSSTPKFEYRDFKIEGAIVANSQADFWDKYNALIDIFQSAGSHQINIAEFGKTYTVFYKETSSTKRESRIVGANLIAVKVDFVFQECGDPYTEIIGIPGTNQTFNWQDASIWADDLAWTE